MRFNLNDALSAPYSPGLGDWERKGLILELSLSTIERLPPFKPSIAERALTNLAVGNRRFIASLPILDVDVHRIVPTQHWVDSRTIEHFVLHSGEIETVVEPPVVALKNGFIFLIDGHHRYIASLMTEKAICPARLLDLDEAKFE